MERIRIVDSMAQHCNWWLVVSWYWCLPSGWKRWGELNQTSTGTIPEQNTDSKSFWKPGMGGRKGYERIPPRMAEKGDFADQQRAMLTLWIELNITLFLCTEWSWRWKARIIRFLLKKLIMQKENHLKRLVSIFHKPTIHYSFTPTASTVRIWVRDTYTYFSRNKKSVWAGTWWLFIVDFLGDARSKCRFPFNVCFYTHHLQSTNELNCSKYCVWCNLGALQP